MLCITMRRGEYFTVDGDTVILVDQLSGERAHLTIHAPRDVAIVRGAVLERSGNPPPACLAELSSSSGIGSPRRAESIPSRMTRYPWPPASTTPAFFNTGFMSVVCASTSQPTRTASART